MKEQAYIFPTSGLSIPGDEWFSFRSGKWDALIGRRIEDIEYPVRRPVTIPSTDWIEFSAAQPKEGDYPIAIFVESNRTVTTLLERVKNLSTFYTHWKSIGPLPVVKTDAEKAWEAFEPNVGTVPIDDKEREIFLAGFSACEKMKGAK